MLARQVFLPTYAFAQVVFKESNQFQNHPRNLKRLSDAGELMDI